jgi:tryptophan synthase alpha chain
VDKIFEMVASVRQKTQVPLVFLTYLNPVFNYGYDRFFARCADLGVDGIIIPDLPYEEKDELAEIAASFGVDVISLIAPTSEQRIKQIAQEATGFIYVVSSMGVTGMRSEIKTDLAAIIEVVRGASSIPIAVGFGINTPQQAGEIAKIADGVIVGSAIVKIIEKHGDNAGAYIYEYVRSMKNAVKELD